MRTTSRALAFATRWFDQATVERVFEPLIADWQREWHDASGFTRWAVSARGLTAFVCAALVSGPRLLRQPTPTAVSNRIVTRVARFAVVVALLLTSAIAWQSAVPLSMLLFLIPSSLAFAFPFAMIGAIDAIRRDHSLPPNVARATVVKLAVAAMAFMIFFGGFIVPAANNAFRVARSERSLRAQGMDEARIARITSSPYARPRGPRELSTFELLTDHGFSDGTRYLPEYVGRELNTRASLVVLPVLLLWLRWHLLDRPASRWTRLPAPVVAVGSCIGYGFLSEANAIGTWPPLLVVAMLLSFDSWRRARRSALA